MLRKRMAVAFVSALVAVGCTDDAAMLTEADADRTVMLRVQQDLIVTLGSNPSTGYRWELQLTPEGHLSLNSSEYEPVGPQIPGSGGKQTFRFTARKSGRTSLDFTSRRPPEPDGATIHYQVVVE
jgi:inhibitor of cysteine peptidase